MQLVLFALLFFGACSWVIASNHLIISFLLALLIVGPISLGSLLWMHNKVDRWVQGLIEEYVRAVANGGALPPHDSMSA